MASWAEAGRQAVGAGLKGLVSQPAAKVASLPTAWKAAILGGVLVGVIGGGLGGWIDIRGGMPGAGGGEAPGVSAPSLVTPSPVAALVAEASPSPISAQQAACPPAPLDTEDSKTYRNEKYGYEVKHPRDWNFHSLKGLALFVKREPSFQPPELEAYGEQVGIQTIEGMVHPLTKTPLTPFASREEWKRWSRAQHVTLETVAEGRLMPFRRHESAAPAGRFSPDGTCYALKIKGQDRIGIWPVSDRCPWVTQRPAGRSRQRGWAVELWEGRGNA